MFTAHEIKKLMNNQPFTPFRIHLTDGSSCAVTNHDSAMVTRNFVVVGVNPDADVVVEQIVRCAILHISRVEDLQPA